ncbi:adventurous gliding motility protein GltJ [Hyalangium rubrum]|uniref:Adventurous gliding motility protein GltJ n=1 Tax=Hyalangium rubrum TaxID=3103134 RepID=A0ABU5H8M4_9BACT|nr:adventurous gliding motility protein GltJ [Hyalangium sp. s54d21]MDY7229821.1 adventurous gliding motility protein GltJ [Hyalangium sp. s54d21]
MRFVCDSCRAQYMISDDKVGAKGAKIKCKKCGHMIQIRPTGAAASKDNGASESTASESGATASTSNGAASSNAAVMPSSIGTPPEGGFFSGMEEDEIGAVFDQVLNSGSQKIPAGEPQGEALESKSATPAAVRKLAEAESEPDEPKAATASHDWFVAIDEKQTGPLTVEKIKDHWDRGEVGPDSLCWRAGFSDWIPLSEVTELASVLAPRPAKPVIVAPAPVTGSTPTVSGPVESAFSAGASAKNTRPEIPAAPALGAEPTSSGWKPSAASVLASLVKEENDALSKPPPKPAPAEKPATGGLLDLPPPEPAAPAARASVMAMAAEPAMPQAAPMAYAQPAPAPAYAQPAPAYPQPAYAAGYPQPAYPGYPPPAAPVPQSGGNKTAMFAGLGVVGLLVVGAVVFFLTRGSSTPQQPVESPPQVAATTPPVVPAAKPPETPVAPPPSTPPTQAAANPQGAVATPTTQPVAGTVPGTPPAATPGTQPAVAVVTPPANTPPPPAAETKPPEPARQDPPTRVAEREPVRSSSSSKPRTNRDEGTTIASSKSPSKPANDGLDDDFDELFGKKPAKTKPDTQSNTPTPYIPPEPGGGGGGKVQEQLAQSDIMSVVLANKPAIVKCVNEQKKRDPGISGKLVMRWTIQPSGKTTAVSVRTDEFKKTYMATCITGLIKGWSFPKHRKQGDPIDFPFTF